MFRDEGGIIINDIIEFNVGIQVLCSNPTTTFTGIFSQETDDMIALIPFSDTKMVSLLGDSFPNAKKLIIPKKNIVAIWILADKILNGEEYEKRRIEIKS